MFQIESKFKLLETIPVSDPWGMGMSFDVRPVSYGPFKAWARASFGGSDAQKELEQYKRYLPADHASEIIARKIEEGLPEADARSISDGVALLVAGWSGVLDQDGGEVELSSDACGQLFAVDVPTEEDIELLATHTEKFVNRAGKDDEHEVHDIIAAGTPIGDALALYLFQYAKDLERYREAHVEEAVKN